MRSVSRKPVRSVARFVCVVRSVRCGLCGAVCAVRSVRSVVCDAVGAVWCDAVQCGSVVHDAQSVSSRSGAVCGGRYGAVR